MSPNLSPNGSGIRTAAGAGAGRVFFLRKCRGGRFSAKMLRFPNFLICVLKYSRLQGGEHENKQRYYCLRRVSLDRGLIQVKLEDYFANFHVPGCVLLDGGIEFDRTDAKRSHADGLPGREFPQE